MSVDQLLTGIPPLAVYGMVALVIGVESVGIPVPGEVVLVSASLFATGADAPFSVHGVAAAAVVGAVVGDSIGYYVGHRWGDGLFVRLARRFPRHVNDDTVGYARHVFHRHGVWAVFFGRFVALLRIFAGPLAGSLHMRYWRFLTANVAGAVAWGAGTAYAIALVGQAAERWLKDFSYVGLIAALGIAIAFATVLRGRLRQRIAEYAERRRRGEIDDEGYGSVEPT